MSAFVSTPAAPSPPVVADLVGNDGFFPPVSIATTRDVLNVTTAITPPRLRDAIVGAIVAINRQLRAWRAKATAASLTDMPQAQVGDVGELVLLYHRAVRAETAAILADFNDTLSATEGGRRREDAEDASQDHHRRMATHCVRDIKGKGRTKVRLV